MFFHLQKIRHLKIIKTFVLPFNALKTFYDIKFCFIHTHAPKYILLLAHRSALSSPVYVKYPPGGGPPK